MLLGFSLMAEQKKTGGRIWGSKDDAGQHGASSGLVCPIELPAERNQMGASLRCFSRVAVNAARFGTAGTNKNLLERLCTKLCPC